MIGGWIIKKAVAGDVLTPQQPQATSASRFHRTVNVIPLELFIKQNYGDEAKKIAEYAKEHHIALHAPNGKISNLPLVLWLAVRLSSFQNWFGDWENDPANASKVVDENGEPLVVYHGTPHGGTAANSPMVEPRSGGTWGTKQKTILNPGERRWWQQARTFIKSERLTFSITCCHPTIRWGSILFLCYYVGFRVLRCTPRY